MNRINLPIRGDGNCASLLIIDLFLWYTLPYLWIRLREFSFYVKYLLLTIKNILSFYCRNQDLIMFYSFLVVVMHCSYSLL